MAQDSQLHDLQLARTNGTQAVLTLVVNNQPGPQVLVTSDDITRMVASLLRAGRAMASAGGSTGQWTSASSFDPVDCDQYAMAVLETGDVALTMAFGTVTSCVSVMPKQLGQLADLLKSAQAGHLVKGPQTSQ